MRYAFILSFTASVVLVLCPLSSRAADNTRAATYILNKYGLEIGEECDYVDALDGGFLEATVAETQTAGQNRKHVSNISVEDVHARIRCDQFAKFLAASLNDNSKFSNGAIYYISSDNIVQQQRKFTHLLLTGLTIPMLDGSAKSNSGLEFQITLSAEGSQLEEPLAGALPPISAENQHKTMQAYAGNFRLTIPGLPTERVRTIEPITISRKIPTDQTGGQRDYTKQPMNWECSNLVFYVHPEDSTAYLSWAEDFLGKGNHLQENEKKFTLELLGRDLKNTLFTLNGTGCGLVSAKYEQPIASSSSTNLGLRVELYVNKMTLESKNNASPAPGDDNSNNTNNNSDNNTANTPPNPGDKQLLRKGTTPPQTNLKKLPGA